jgi:hypothetical protein
MGHKMTLTIGFGIGGCGIGATMAIWSPTSYVLRREDERGVERKERVRGGRRKELERGKR